MDLTVATEVVGGLSKPSKMPCFSYNLPAQACKIGGALQNVAGSVCHKCYAMRGNYRFPHVKNALQRRLESITKPDWENAMVALITDLYHRRKHDVFRWHDSGDLQSLQHLEKIAYVCYQTPWVKHWLPTREVGIVSQYLKKRGEFPANLVVRVSATMVDGDIPDLGRKVLYSAVHTVQPIKGAVECKAKYHDNKCGDCRVCWNKRVKIVSYPKH